MNPIDDTPAKARIDVVRNRALLLETAQRHFLQYGVNASLNAIAKDAGVGPGTLYRHFPNRDALLAALLESKLEELRQGAVELQERDDPAQALRQWLQMLEDYCDSYNGLAEPLLMAAQESGEANPLSYPCTEMIALTGQFLGQAQRAGCARQDVKAKALFRATAAVAWIKSWDSDDRQALADVRHLLAVGYAVE